MESRPRRRRVVSCLVAVVVLCGPDASAAVDGRPRFERLDQDVPLSHSSVHAILQDRTGFLWLATPDGLNRFDGHEVRVFRHQPSDRWTISSNLVHALVEDGSGRLWIGTEAGIDRLDRARGRFVRYDLGPSPRGHLTSRVTTIFETREGALLAGFDGLFRYDPGTDRFERLLPGRGNPPGPRREIAGIAQDSAGAVWVLERQFPGPTILSQLDPVTGDARPFVVEPHDLVPFAFLIDAKDRFWVDAAGPLEFDEGRQRFVQPARTVGRTSWAICEQRGGDLWFGFDGAGLTRIRPSGLSDEQLLGENPGFLENFVRALHEDRAGTLWVGTHGGLYRLDPNRKPFLRLRHSLTDPNTLSHDAVSALLEGAGGEIWIGTYGGGLNHYDPLADRVTRIRGAGWWGDAESDPVIRSLARDDQGVLWVGTESGLERYDPAGRRITRVPLPVRTGTTRNTAVNSIAIDSSGTLWLATAYGLYRFDPVTGTATVYTQAADASGPAGSYLQGLLLDGSSGLWIGSEGQALDRLDFDSGKFAHFPLVDEEGHSLASQGVWQIRADPAGDLWLGTGFGLLRFDRARRRFERFSDADGLPGTIVYGIAADGDGRLWLGTNQGLSRFGPTGDSETPFWNFDRGDGLGVREFNRQAALRASSGEIYFGTMEGVLRFDPRAIQPRTTAPPVVVTRLERADADGVWSVDPATIDTWELSYGDRSFSFEFAALDFTSPARARYRYLLDGFDEAWSAIDERRFARYTNVPAGRYTFRVKAANADGVWNDEGAALAITIAPPYWQRWWFRALLILCLAALLIGLHRYRLSRAMALEQLRLGIASDLHDDLSSDLSGVAIWAELMARREHLTERDRRELGQVQRSVTNMLDGLRDCVWYINPEHDSLTAMVHRMRATAERLAGAIPCRVTGPERDGTGTLSMTTRRNLFLIFKEALHNAVHHARASRVDVSVDVRDGRVSLRVADDGIGFDPAAPSEGNGLLNLQRRARQIGADLAIQSKPGNGTVVTVATRPTLWSR